MRYYTLGLRHSTTRIPQSKRVAVRRARRVASRVIPVALLLLASVLPAATRSTAATKNPATAVSCRVSSNLPLSAILGPGSFVERIGDRIFNIGLALPGPNPNGVVYFCSDGSFEPACGFDGFSYRSGISSSNLQSVVPGLSCNTLWQVTTTDHNSFILGLRAKFEQGASGSNTGTPSALRFQVSVNPSNTPQGQQISLFSGEFQITTLPDDGSAS